MDPDANLYEQVTIAARLITEHESILLGRDFDEIIRDGLRLAELVQALDTWICNGGFLPSTWRKE